MTKIGKLSPSVNDNGRAQSKFKLELERCCSGKNIQKASKPEEISCRNNVQL
jgi:hypothetical protein